MGPRVRKGAEVCLAHIVIPAKAGTQGNPLGAPDICLRKFRGDEEECAFLRKPEPSEPRERSERWTLA